MIQFCLFAKKLALHFIDVDKLSCVHFLLHNAPNYTGQLGSGWVNSASTNQAGWSQASPFTAVPQCSLHNVHDVITMVSVTHSVGSLLCCWIHNSVPNSMVKEL